jgi:hypothetical protein
VRRRTSADVAQLELFGGVPTLPAALAADAETVPAPATAVLTPGVPLVEAVVALGEVSGALSADDRHYLLGPVVLHPVSECADWIRDAIPAARLKQVLGRDEANKGLCSLEDALAYLSSASLAMPLAGDDAEMFFWLSQELCPQYGLTRDEPVWKSLGYPGPIELTPYLRSSLDALRSKIRAAIVKHARRGEAEARRLGKQTPGNGGRARGAPAADNDSLDKEACEQLSALSQEGGA